MFVNLRIGLITLCMLVAGRFAFAQDDTATSQPATAPASSSYDGPWWTWPKATGDWAEARTDLENKGIKFEMDITQIFQNNAYGGESTKNGSRYSGSGDITLTMDTHKMGLWPYGTIVVNGEPKWGNGINSKTGALLPVNFDATKPGDDSCMMALSEWFLIQGIYQGALGKAAIIIGKVDLARAFDTNVFANDERTQFMNVGLRNDPQLGQVVGYTPLAVSLVYLPTDWLTIFTAFGDSDGQASHTGFDTAFHGDPKNFAFAHEWQIKVKPFNLPGTQRIAFGWSPKHFNHVNPVPPLAQLSPALIHLIGLKRVNKLSPYLPYDKGDDNVIVWYNFDQYVYTKPGDPTQGIGLFGRFGWAREDVNPLNFFYSIGIGGKGLIPERKKDTYGIGYFYGDLSNRLPSILHSEQGIECYYNIEVTPWLHISPDIQLIMDPGGTDEHKAALVWGFRMQMSL